MLESDKKRRAEKAFCEAINGNFKLASKLRQEAYAKDPPASIGIDWCNWGEVWKRDAQYISYLEKEDFSDCENTTQKIEAMKVGIFVDYLFGFRDCWGAKRQKEFSKEPVVSRKLEIFLKKSGWDFESVDRDIIYTETKKKNIASKIYIKRCKNVNMDVQCSAYVFPEGEYDLGFLPGTSKEIIEARRKWLNDYDLFLKLKKLNICSFPKTFQTFEKHRIGNTEKYQMWIDEYGRKRV